RRNNLNWLSWKIFDHFQISELLLQDNPLTCNCSVLWLQTLPHNITCVDGPFTSPRSIRALRITGCELPQLTIEPPNAVIELGGGVNFTCSSKNLFSTHLTWNKTSLGLNETHARMNSSLLLTIHKAASPGQTLVQCSAENEIGRSNVHAVLEITARPKIVRLYSHLSFYWSICYSITGYPNANLSWKLNDTDLDAFEHNILNVVDTSTAGSLNGCLQLPGTSLDLHGKYTLTASNTISSTTRSILFNPGVAPVSKSKPSRFRPNTSSKFPLFSLILYVLGVAILILILIIGLLAFLRHRRHQKRRLNILQFSHLLDNPTYARQSEIVLPSISPSKIHFIRSLGEGAFGRVFLGVVEGLVSAESSTKIAIKTLKEEFQAKELIQEAKLLTTLKHQHIVCFYGLVKMEEKLLMLFEFMDQGDLNTYLRNHSPNNPENETEASLKQLTNMAWQIASGGQYLASQHFIHRDLATRNCLVNKKLTVKIGDFGMSRDVYTSDYYKVGGQTLLPVRWMPPEALLYRRFSIQSDVWSFGVVLWEIFTFGQQPWYCYTNHEAVQQIINGRLLPSPRNTPDELYRIMLNCWHQQPNERITMKEIQRKLNHLIEVFQIT
uniref:receptor protein-tyrosine kinase n=1 Tax=Strigamia maritima TaxID=126957 RepID=T1JCR9_STRMM